MRFGFTSVGLVAVVAVLAGCGGGSSPNSSSAAANASTGASAASSSTTAAAPSFASSQNCQQLVALGAKYLKQIQATSASGGTVDFSAAVKAEQALADASPSAIHSDAEYVVHVFAGFAGTMQKLGYKPGTTPSASQIAGLTAAVQQLNQPQFQAALRHLTTWESQNCHGVTP